MRSYIYIYVMQMLVRPAEYISYFVLMAICVNLGDVEGVCRRGGRRYLN